jgi:hypothetical protein
MAISFNPASNDPAVEASRLLARLGYAVLGLGAPCSEALSPRAIFLFFPIGVALLLVAAMLDPPPRFLASLKWMLTAPFAWAGLCLIGWAALSLFWTPFPLDGAQHLLKLAATILITILAIASSREHMRAADLYLFPVGVLLAMIAILVLAVARRQQLGADLPDFSHSGVALVALLFPAMGCLAARGRNGLARLLMILALAFTFVIGAPTTTVALLVGFTALSFAISDAERTLSDLGAAAAGIILLAPIVPAISPTLAHWFFHDKLSALPEPFPPLSVAADIVLHDPARLFTGRGIDAAIKGMEAGLLPPRIPRVILFELWYELGVIGALLAAANAGLGFRAIGRTGEKVAPYFIAAFAADLALGFLSEDFSQMWWVNLLAVSAISAGAAARSQYRTQRPSALRGSAPL